MTRILLFFLLMLSLLFIGCKKEDKTSTSNTSQVTPYEQLLVGKWNLKRLEFRGSLPYIAYQDSIYDYFNKYNYSTSMFNFTSTPKDIVSGVQNFNLIWGTNDGGEVIQSNWHADTNVIYIEGDLFMIKYLSNDSMMLEKGNGSGTRYYLSKNTLLPVLNNIELQLLGRWQSSPNSFIIFKNIWNNQGYQAIDSVNSNVDIYSWEILCPEKPVPIMFYSATYFKITNLTANSFTWLPLNISTGNTYGSPITFTKQ